MTGKLNLLTLVFCFSAISAQGFTLNSASDSRMRGWADPHVIFKINPANCPANINEIVDSAMGVWNGVPTSHLLLTRGDNTATTFAQLQAGTATDVPVIICDPNFVVDVGGGSGIAGVGFVSSPAAGGNISYAYLLINVQAGDSGSVLNADYTTTAIVLAHEMGHVLGLGHTPDANALMYYNVGAKKNLTLAQDDVDGISYLYPRNEIGKDKVLGCSSVASLGAGPPPSPNYYLGLLLFILSGPLLIVFYLRQKKSVSA